ncbi:MAG: hypothetical protein AAGG45_00220 [Pseudomonadota bacterium]
MMAALPMIGHGAAEARFLAARASGRLHHGWLVRGPSGVGKSIFVKRLAALILGAETPDATKSDPVMQKVISGSHPDLKWVKREPNERGKLKQDISVDQLRDLNAFFALRPALSGWRVGVIDAIDEANRSGTNAILKTLEEPPKNALLFLIDHGSEALLPTIRSRCQTLNLSRLLKEDVKQVFDLTGQGDALALDLAEGRPGYGIALAASGGGGSASAARAMVKTLPKPDPNLVASAIEAASKDASSLNAFADTLMDWAAQRATDQPHMAKTWLSLQRVRAEAAFLKLTETQKAAKLFSVLNAGVKAAI